MSLPSAVVFSRYLSLHFITTLHKWFTFPWQWTLFPPRLLTVAWLSEILEIFVCLWWESQRSRPCHATWARVLALAWQEGRWEGLSAVQASAVSPVPTGSPSLVRALITWRRAVLILRLYFHFRHSFIWFSLFEYFLSIRLYWYLVWLRLRGFVYSGWLHRGSGAR